jgi:hypothetical protein
MVDKWIPAFAGMTVMLAETAVPVSCFRGSIMPDRQ